MNIYIPFLILFLISSCTTDIDFRVPVTKFDTPETKGTFLAGDVSLGFAGAHKITTAEVYEDIIFNSFTSINSETSLDISQVMAFKSNLGLLRRLDIVYDSFVDSPSFLSLKFQFLGSPENEARPGLKASIKSGWGTMNQNDGTLNVSNSDGTNKRSYSGNIKIDSTSSSLIIGYRFNKYILLYANGCYDEYKTESTLTSNTFDDIIINGNLITKTGIMGLKLNISTSLFYFIEGGKSETVWEKRDKQTIDVLGMSMGFSW